jgi:hypothetical protein
MKLGETHKKPKFTSPSPMKATPTGFNNDPNDVCLTSFRDDDDVTVRLLGRDKETYVNHSTHPPEGKTITVVAVIRGKSKNGRHRQHNNRHYKKKLVRVL